jgi:4-diphosphocytidyl-2-C-methyl-D-erythritol kinase
MPELAEAAPAKINLYLHVTGRRADGYHLLDSLVVFAGAADALRVAPAEGLTLAVEGPFAGALAGEGDNLVLRAARALAARAGIAPRGALTLTKRLPVASGIGGGSADAAAALRLLARFWGVPPADGAMAVTLGADVPVCLAARPARMQGIGEVLLAAPRLPPFGLVLVNPGVAVPTPAVFRARGGGFRAAAALPDAWPDAGAMAADLAGLENDLEAAAVGLAPAIGEVLAALRALPGGLLARMSGSGATCFALFADAAAAAAAARAVARPGWWCWGGAAGAGDGEGVAEAAGGP